MYGLDITKEGTYRITLCMYHTAHVSGTTPESASELGHKE